MEGLRGKENSRQTKLSGRKTRVSDDEAILVIPDVVVGERVAIAVPPHAVPVHVHNGDLRAAYLPGHCLMNTQMGCIEFRAFAR